MIDPLEAVIVRLKAAGSKPHGCGLDKYRAKCPCHVDRKASLSVGRGDDRRLLIHCHMGCSYETIMERLGLDPADGFEHAARDKPGRPPRRPSVRVGNLDQVVIATGELFDGNEWRRWHYRDGAGRDVVVIVRYVTPAGKEYRPFHPTEDGQWKCGYPRGVGPLPLLYLDSLRDAETVLFCEGEKCTDIARGLGYAATTATQGASGIGRADLAPLAGKLVVILADNDDAGRRCAKELRRMLAKLPKPAVAIVVDLPGLPEGGDIEQWASGFPGVAPARESLDALIAAARLAPAKPATPSKEADVIAALRNEITEATRALDEAAIELRFCPVRTFRRAFPKSGVITIKLGRSWWWFPSWYPPEFIEECRRNGPLFIEQCQREGRMPGTVPSVRDTSAGVDLPSGGDDRGDDDVHDSMNDDDAYDIKMAKPGAMDDGAALDTPPAELGSAAPSPESSAGVTALLDGWRADLAEWTGTARERWAERAAIMQFDGGYDRDEAEGRAYLDVRSVLDAEYETAMDEFVAEYEAEGGRDIAEPVSGRVAGQDGVCVPGPGLDARSVDPPARSL